MCTLLNMEAEPAHGKVSCINECALYEHAASWLLLFRLTSAPLKCQCSQSHLLTLYSFPVWPRQVLTMLVNPHLFMWTTYLLNSKCTFPCGYLTGIANLCFLKAEPWSCLPNLPSSTCCGSSVREIVQCQLHVLSILFQPFLSISITLPLFMPPLFPSQTVAKASLTVLPKSSLPLSKLYTAARSHKAQISDHVTICPK